MPVTNYDMSEIAIWNMYKESYDFMMGHPVVKQMKKENKKLKKEVAHLKTMLAITQENMRLLFECNRTKKSKPTNPLYTTTSETENTVDVINLDDVLEEPNIKYEIIENYVDIGKNVKESVEDKNEVEDTEAEEEVEVEAEDEVEVEVEAEEEVEVEVEVEAEEEVEVEVEAEEEVEVEVEVEAEEEVEVEEEAEEEVEVEEEAEEEVEVEVEEEAEEEVEVEAEEEVEEEVEVEAEEEVEETKSDKVPVEPDTEEESEEVFEIIIDGKTYYTDDREWGSIYDIDENGEINMEVGKFSNGVVKFY